MGVVVKSWQRWVSLVQRASEAADTLKFCPVLAVMSITSVGVRGFRWLTSAIKWRV